MQTLEAITTVEVPVQSLIECLGKRKALQFIKSITEDFGDSIVEIKKGTRLLSVEQVEDEF